jgi:hypothetical protein
MATTSVIFPNTINVVLNDTLSSFISTTTVSPTVAGTFVFNLNNSSGAVLTASSVFDAVGNFTIYCSFTPTDSVTYQASSATVIVTVQDNDAYNNYFNIPVTDLSNILVNGDFNYIPSSIASGTSAICPPNVPGWRFLKYTSYPAVVNNINLSSFGITSLPYPFGTKCVQFVGGYMSQPVFCIAGSYTLSAYIAAKTVATSAQYLQFWINNVSITTSNAQYPTLNNWQQLSVTFTIAKTGFQNIMIGSVASNTFYIGNISIKPVVSNLISYLKFSKISSQIFNGTFETEIKTENSKLLTPLANWTIVNNNVWVLNNYSTYTTIPLPYPSGNQCVAFEGLGKITQSFTYTASTLNYLSFYLCIIGDLSMNQIKVSINSTMICDLSNSNASFGQGSGTWQKVLFTNITTVDGTNTLTIEGLDNTNTGKITAIDNVVFGSVNKSVPSITYSTQTNTYGTPLLNNLIATCSVSATITYFLDSAYTNQVYNDSTLPVGTYTIYVIAVPLDTYNYLTSYTSATLNVVTPSLSVVFPNIINVVFNDTLSSFISTTTVSPTVAGTFVFNLNNSSGAVLTASSVFDAVGNFTIYSSFTPTDSVTYAACSASYTVSVQDKDLFNNYFNIPVTDVSNILVNGNFDYIPSSIASGTSLNSTGPLINVPGWIITSTILYNNVDLSFGLTFPYPFGTKCLRLRAAIYQFFYCVAGTYTLSFYLGVPVTTTGTNYMTVNIDTTRAISAIANQGWQLKTVNFTIATTGMHYILLNYTSSSTYYIGNVIITPVNNFTYLKPSKINSLISNGVFETEIKTANSKSLTPITNWTVVNNNVWILNNYSSYAAIPSPYPSGNQCIAIESLGKVSQTFTATASSSNFLSFYACSVSNASTNTLRFSINNNIIADVNTNVYRSGTWTKVIYGNITTISGTNTLSIEGITSTTNFISAIDNVIFGQVNKETRAVSFSPQSNYYGTTLAANLNATTDISGTYTYYIDASYNNRVYADSTLPVGTYTLYVVFAPSDAVDYNTLYANTTLTVVMPPLRVVFPNTINVVLNDTLSSFISGTAVSPTVEGTFVFNLNNISGAVLTASSVFNAVGNFTIYCSFTPTDSVTYTGCSATYTVTVEDSDAYNNYFNIPVTDLSNILINGNFNYIPSTYLSGTKTSNSYNVPGWRFYGTTELFNNYNFNISATFPPPFGPICLRLVGASMYQASYYIAGTYTFSMTYCNLYSNPTGYFRFYLDGVQIFNQYLGTLNNWQTLTFNFTVATTGMHYFQIYQSSTTAYFGNLNISPISVSNNVSYMKFSKINSQIFNGTFETEIKTANSKSLTPLANWTIVNNNVWVLNNYLANSTTIVLPYPSGSQCVGIEGLGKISQTFNYIDSSFNYLSFYACSVRDSSTNPLTIRMNGTTIGAANFPSCGQGSWAKFLFTNITTVAGTNTLTIEGLDTTNTGKITAIDNVVFGSVNMAPTTTTYSITTPIKYGSTVSSVFTAACSVPATFTYYLDDAYTNQVFADSTLPVGNYQMYVKSTPIDIYYYLTSFASASFSVVNPNPLLVFPKIINVVYNDTLANFINYTTVTPNIAGTFAFTNSSGSTLTTNSVYNVIGKFTIYCTFTPTDTATYETTSAIYSVTVEDNDAPNNYFNIPVTNTTNLLVNGNFEYVPSTYPPGTVTSNQIALTASNIPGWRFVTTNTSNSSAFINDVSLTSAISYPFPFSGNKCAALRGGQIYQMVFLNAGTYTFSAYIARSVLQLINSYLRVYVDGKRVFVSSTLYQSLTNWQYITFTFTVSTTNIHEIFVTSAGGPTHYIGNMSIVPTYSNPVYLHFSKIDSQIFNGSFETEIKTANSKAIVPLTNWTTQNNTIWVLNNYSSYGAIPLPYPSGNQCIAIENLGQITQTFNYTASSLNYLSFYICGDASSNPVQFSLNGTTICTLNNCSSAGGTWQKCIYTNLTTISGTNTLTIQGTVNNKLGYIGIDNVILGQVNRAITTVTYPTPSPIVYGTTLVNSLNASCTVPGTFKYYIDISYNTQVFSDTILIPSIYSIYVIYTPTDQVNYAPGFATADLSINKLTPTLTYPALSPIYYGTLLETSLIATANIPCKIDYYLDAARTIGVNGLTVLNIGSYTIYAYLIPTDMVTYSPILTSSTLTVNSAGIITPTMYYPSVTQIMYGATLAGKLNASVLPNIPGTINYYTDSNFVNQVTTYTVLTPGIWSIYAVFTPNDLSSCNTTTSSVSLFVSNISSETRSLVLNTRDISASTNADDYFNITITNATGVVENNRYTHTWNTNLRSILGDDFYNKYTKFSIRLKDFVNGNLFTTIQDASQNLSLYYKSFNECKLSGIQFDPQPYENGISTNAATIQTLTRQFPASSVSYYNVFDGCGSAYTFSKTTDIVPIKIDMPNLYDDQYFAPSTNAILFGHLTFVFEVRGILS